ncbi:MAG: hypothetical protein OXU73_01865 [Candidatus Campbellbacteria bacterium]|nr:hypothetical protein [Candidatus Campbellbacteria bacterium]
MTTNLEKILEIIEKSDISSESVKDFVNSLKKVKDEDLKPLHTLFMIHPKWILWMSENFKAKKEAFAKKDSKKWEEIMKKEEDLLKRLAGESK